MSETKLNVVFLPISKLILLRSSIGPVRYALPIILSVPPPVSLKAAIASANAFELSVHPSSIPPNSSISTII